MGVSPAMTYEKFEDLPVWQEAIRLAEHVYSITESPKFRPAASFRSQIERAALPVSNNIAEGFERGTTPELLQFIYIARGSAGETRSMLRLLGRNARWLPESGDLVEKGIELAKSCSKQLRTWADYLQNTEITGQRHLNKKEAARHEDARRAREFQIKLKKGFPVDKPLPTGEWEKALKDEGPWRRET